MRQNIFRFYGWCDRVEITPDITAHEGDNKWLDVRNVLQFIMVLTSMLCVGPSGHSVVSVQ